MRGIVLSRSAVTVTEGDTSGAGYTIRLRSEPTGTVTVSIEPPAGTDVRTDAASYGFTPTSWDTPLTVTVTAVHDDDAAADPAAAIAHSVTGGGYSGVTVDDTVTVTIVEDDAPGIDVEADADPATVAEGGEIDLRVKLDAQPSGGNVTVTLAVPSELSANPSTLTFTTGDWSTVQTVTVEALDDDDAVADGAFTIGFTASGADYGGVMESIALTVTEDDAVGVTFAPESLTVTEEGAAGTYTAVLTSAPTARVTVRPQAPAGSDVEISPAFHRFTASNWNEPKSFSVTGLDDADSDDDVVMVAHGVTGGDYDGFVPDPYPVTVTDSDVPSTEVRLSVVPTGVAEDAGATTVTVTGQLDGAPRTSDTVVTVRVEAPGSGTDAAEGGDFEPVANFPLTILADHTGGTAGFTFEPVDDDVDEGDEIVRVAGTASGTTLTVSGTDLTIIEDDAKGIVLAPSAVSPTEGETTGEQYTVRLASEPTGTVTVHADAPAGSDVRVASSGTPALTASLTFTTTNWETPQPFTVTAVEDADGEDDTGLAISHRVAGADYEGLTVDRHGGGDH